MMKIGTWPHIFSKTLLFALPNTWFSKMHSLDNLISTLLECFLLLYTFLIFLFSLKKLGKKDIEYSNKMFIIIEENIQISFTLPWCSQYKKEMQQRLRNL